MAAAVRVADVEGLEALTMRRLGTKLGVEAMSLYKHVASKDEILDGIVEAVIAEIEIPMEAADWKEAMRRRAVSARDVLRRHSWAIGLLETRRLMGPSLMRYLDAILGSLRSGGFSVENAAHAFWLLDAYVYGHVVQEANLSRSQPDEANDPGAGSLEEMAGSEHGHLAEVAAHAVGSPFTFDAEFEFGLGLILDALERVGPSEVASDRTDLKPSVLFLCVHNAGRSQMAAGFMRHLAGDRVDVFSGGSEPASELNSVAVAAMAEKGIDISTELPQPWADEIVRAADVIVTMGCGDACPVYPGKRYVDWELADPAGKPIEEVRRIRDDLERRVHALLAELTDAEHG